MYKTLTQSHTRGHAAAVVEEGSAGRRQPGPSPALPGAHPRGRRRTAALREGAPAVLDTPAWFPGGGCTRSPEVPPQRRHRAQLVAAPLGRAQQPLRLRAAAASPRGPPRPYPPPGSPAPAAAPRPRRRLRPRSPELHLQRHGRRHLGSSGAGGERRARAAPEVPRRLPAAPRCPATAGRRGRPWTRTRQPRPGTAPPLPGAPAAARAALVRAGRAGWPWPRDSPQRSFPSAGAQRPGARSVRGCWKGGPFLKGCVLGS